MQKRIITICQVSRTPCIPVSSLTQRAAKEVKQVNSGTLVARRSNVKDRLDLRVVNRTNHVIGMPRKHRRLSLWH
jgi:hypothetical protein